MGHPRATLTEAAEAHAVSGRSLPLCGWASLERVGGATNSFFLVCVESPWRVLDRGARTLSRGLLEQSPGETSKDPVLAEGTLVGRGLYSPGKALG